MVDNVDNVSRMALSIGKGAGTTRYAAPEVILDYMGGKYSDMWSLGVILYEILYDGKHPLMAVNKNNYPDTISRFTSNMVKIDFPPRPGFEKMV